MNTTKTRTNLNTTTAHLDILWRSMRTQPTTSMKFSVATAYPWTHPPAPSMRIIWRTWERASNLLPGRREKSAHRFRWHALSVAGRLSRKITLGCTSRPTAISSCTTTDSSWVRTITASVAQHSTQAKVCRPALPTTVTSFRVISMSLLAVPHSDSGKTCSNSSKTWAKPSSKRLLLPTVTQILVTLRLNTS